MPQDRPRPEVSSAQAGIVVGVWALVVLAVSVFGHPTALYTVETDLIGEYLPTAREFLHGILNVVRFGFKGPGYPLILAAVAAPLQGNVELAARIVSPLASGVAAWLTFILVRRIAGYGIATFSLLALLATPVFVRYAIEAGTDAPALALMLGTTVLVLREGRPPSRLAAGLLAGYAILTRTNAGFLLPCGLIILVVRRECLRSLFAYAIGVALPVAAWNCIGALAGGLPPDRNYLNVAWELYGRGVRWDQFEATIGSRFHSMFDVIAYDPLAGAGHLLRNFLIHRVRDARELVPVWIGLFALPGLVLLGRDRRCRPWLLHALACALVLAPVFYNSRFGLYLLPVYVTAAGAALATLVNRFGGTGKWSRQVPVAGALLAGTLVMASASAAVLTIHGELADAPHETRIAGRKLRDADGATGGVIARKPHVAWYSGLRFTPMPMDVPLSRLPAFASSVDAEYLFFSNIEQLQHPEWGVLADSGLVLPGFAQVGWDTLPNRRFYALYRFTGDLVDSARFAAAYRGALGRYEARRPGSASALLFVAVQYLAIGDPAAARDRLNRLVQAGAQDPAVEKYLLNAAFAMGDLAGAEAACRRAMALERPTAWHWGRMGDIRTGQGRLGDARDCYERAVALEPASLSYLQLLGQANIRTREFTRAAAAFERGVRLAPADVETRRYAMGAWQLAGEPARMQRIYEDGVKVGIPAEALLGSNESSH